MLLSILKEHLGGAVMWVGNLNFGVRQAGQQVLVPPFPGLRTFTSSTVSAFSHLEKGDGGICLSVVKMK